jgi:hydrogenase maturation protease
MSATQTKPNPQKLLVIGVGNEFRNDDAVGINVARKLRKLNISAIQIMEDTGDGAKLIEKWKDQDVVVVVDAASSGSEPGMIYRFDAVKQKMPTQFFNYSSHNFSVAEAVEMSRTLNQLPKRLVVYGIEGKDFAQGNSVTSPVKKAAEYVLDIIVEEFRTKHSSVQHSH